MSKQIKITLRQADGGQFRVEKFSNTAQLSIGQMVPVSKLEYWTGLPLVNVEVVGRVQDDAASLDERADVLELAGGER